MGKMQELHREIRQSEATAARGSAKPRRAAHVRNDRNVQMAMDTLQLWLLDNTPEPTVDDLRARLIRHLGRVRHCLG